MKTKVGVAWYSPQGWGELRAIAPDADKLEASYEEWVEVVERGLADLRRAGLQPQRVEIAIAPFVAWCDRMGRRPDAAARAAYVAEQLQALQGPGAEHRDA